MRLIDADECLRQIRELEKSPWFNDSPFEDYSRSIELAVRKDAVHMVRDVIIKGAETIDTVIHGHWIPVECDEDPDYTGNYHSFICSECGDCFEYLEECYDVKTMRQEIRYCSNCGARMDGVATSSVSRESD